MVEAMSDVECEFCIGPVVCGAFAQGAFDVDDQVARGFVFAWDGFASKADDIGRSIFAEEFQIGRDDSCVVGQQHGNLTPAGLRVGCGETFGEFSGQRSELRKMDPYLVLLVDQ